MKSNVMEKTIELLVIDDDPVILNSINKQLKKEDMVLSMFANPVDAIESIDEKNYDIVLCDVKMEPISGIEVLRIIKKHYPQLPVIILTGFVDDKIMNDAQRTGCNGFLIKPIRKAELIKTIKKLLYRD